MDSQSKSVHWLQALERRLRGDLPAEVSVELGWARTPRVLPAPGVDLNPLNYSHAALPTLDVHVSVPNGPWTLVSFLESSAELRSVDRTLRLLAPTGIQWRISVRHVGSSSDSRWLVSAKVGDCHLDSALISRRSQQMEIVGVMTQEHHQSLVSRLLELVEEATGELPPEQRASLEQKLGEHFGQPFSPGQLLTASDLNLLWGRVRDLEAQIGKGEQSVSPRTGTYLTNEK